MIKMYVMHTCPDCEYVEKQVEGNPDFLTLSLFPSLPEKRPLT